MAADPGDMSARLVQLLLWAAGGGAVGLVYLEGLRRNADAYSQRRVAEGVALHVARVALIGAALVVAAMAGALPLLCFFGGFLASRQRVVARALRERR